MGFFDGIFTDTPSQRLAKLKLQEAERQQQEADAVRSTGVNYLSGYKSPEEIGATPQIQQRNLLGAAAIRGSETTPDGLNRRTSIGGNVFGYDAVPTPDLMNAAFPQQAMARTEAAAFPARIDPDKRFKVQDGQIADLQPPDGGTPRFVAGEPKGSPADTELVNVIDSTKPDAKPYALTRAKAAQLIAAAPPGRYSIAGAISDASAKPKWEVMSEAEAGQKGLPKGFSFKIDRTSGNIEKVVSQDESALLSPEALQMGSEQLAAGDQSPLQGLGFGNTGAKNRIAQREAFTKYAKEKLNWSGADIAAANAEFFGTKAGERALGTRSANIEMSVNEAGNMAKLARDASAEVPRGKWVPVNKAMLLWNSQSGEPKTRAFGAAVNSYLNAYATAVGKGTMTVDARNHASQMLSTADGPQAFNAIMDQLDKEIQAAKAAPGQVRGSMRDAITSGAGKPSAPTAGAYVWTPDGGLVPK